MRIGGGLRPSLSVHTACRAAGGRGWLTVASRWKWGSLGPPLPWWLQVPRWEGSHGNVWSFHGSPCVSRVPLGHTVLECWGVWRTGSLGQAPGAGEGAAARPRRKTQPPALSGSVQGLARGTSGRALGGGTVCGPCGRLSPRPHTCPAPDPRGHEGFPAPDPAETGRPSSSWGARVHG